MPAIKHPHIYKREAQHSGHFCGNKAGEDEVDFSLLDQRFDADNTDQREQGTDDQPPDEFRSV